VTFLAQSRNPTASDAQLLERFLDHEDAEAFAVLVARHGPMVYAVCRRVMGDVHRADDAFQATFLILARRARDVNPSATLRAWLYGVAVRTALTARARTNQRLKREIPVASLPDRPAPARTETDPDVLRMLDEEIARLPEKLRASVVLCELDGRSRKEAAAQLGISEGTLSSRLAAARRTLAARLRARGVLVPAAAFAALFSRANPAAAVPGELTESAARLATPDLAPPGVDELTRGVFKTLLLAKLAAPVTALVLAGVLVSASLAEGPGTLLQTIPQKPPARLSLVPAFAPTPVPRLVPREGVILVTSFSKERPAELYKPDGMLIGKPAVGAATSLWKARISPDARRALVFRLGPIPQNTGPWTPNHLFVLDLDAKDGPSEALMHDLRWPEAVWSPDGTKLYGSQVDPEKENQPREAGKLVPLVSWVYELQTMKKTPLAIPEGHEIRDISRDGKTLLTSTHDSKTAYPTRSYLVPIATFKPRALLDKSFDGMRFSPDGKSVLGQLVGEKPGDLWKFSVVTVADGSARTVKLPDGANAVYHACWSPDGKRIAYHWHEEVPAPPGHASPTWRVSRVTVADADGGNAKTIIRRDDDELIYGLDWR
jgi:RNA polymerase sigma factor (sigma-70 family)